MQRAPIKLPPATPDQIEYLEKIRRATKDYDGSAIVGGPQKEKDMAKTFWLVERYVAGRLHYWSAGARGRGHRDDWSTDVGFATKLADSESADQVMLHICGGDGRSVEHSFLQPA